MNITKFEANCIIVGLTAVLLFMATGCNGSPTQAHGDFSLFTFDNRTFYEVAGNATNDARMASGGHGSNSRVYSDTLQAMVLYKSPVSANSNSTPISVDIPLVK